MDTFLMTRCCVRHGGQHDKFSSGSLSPSWQTVKYATVRGQANKEKKTDTQCFPGL